MTPALFRFGGCPGGDDALVGMPWRGCPGEAGVPQDRPEIARFPVNFLKISYRRNDPYIFQIWGVPWRGRPGGDALVGTPWWGCPGGDALVRPKWGVPQDRPEIARFPVNLLKISYRRNDPCIFQIWGVPWWGRPGGDALVGMPWWGCPGGDALLRPKWGVSQDRLEIARFPVNLLKISYRRNDPCIFQIWGVPWWGRPGGDALVGMPWWGCPGGDALL